MKSKFNMCFVIFIFFTLNGFSQSVSVANEKQKDVDADLAHPTYAVSAAHTDNWGFARYGFLDLRAGGAFSASSQMMEGVALGRWFTPSFGGRLAVDNLGVDGFDSMYGHVDMMYNTASLFSHHGTCWHRWQWVPFVGVGVTRTVAGDPSYIFAYNYGLDIRCRLSRSLFFVAGVDAVTAAGNAAYIDRMKFLPSLGLSMALGRVGNQPRTNGSVYFNESDCLYNVIEGTDDDGSDEDAAAVNDYSGLNSLRARLANPDWDGQGDAPRPVDGVDPLMTVDARPETEVPVSKTKVLSTPVYFFFHLGGVALLVPNQLVNLDDIAAIAVEEDCTVSVAGAADAATGAEETNNALAMKRAEYISSRKSSREAFLKIG